MSRNSPLSRRNVSSAWAAAISVSRPFGAAPSNQLRNAPWRRRRADGRRGRRQLRRVLARLHQGDRVGPDVRLAAGLGEEPGQAFRRGRGVEQDFLLFARRALSESRAARRAAPVGQFRQRPGGRAENFSGSRKRRGLPRRGISAKPSAIGVWATSAPRRLKAQARACGSLTSKASAESALATRFNLASAASPAYFFGWRTTGGQRRRGAIGPQRVDRVFVHGDETRPGFFRRGLETRDLRAGVQPGIVADAGAFLGVVASQSLGETSPSGTNGERLWS